jgi:hypothetical protein
MGYIFCCKYNIILFKKYYYTIYYIMATINGPINSFTLTEAPSGITSSSNGQILYASFQQITGYAFYVSTNNGVSWGPVSIITPGLLEGRFPDVTCNGDGTIIYAPWEGAALYKSIDSGSNWTELTNTFPNGQGTNNFVGVATDSTGTKILASSQIYTYISTDSGANWLYSPLFTSGGLNPVVACSSDFSIRYAVLNGNIYKSTDPTNQVWTLIPGNFSSTWISIACDSTGEKVFAVNQTPQTYYFSGGTSQLLSSSSIIGNITCYSNGNGIAATGGTLATTYSMTYPEVFVPCFKDDSKILCFKDDVEVYVNVQDIRKGDLVKTLQNGYVAVNMIGTTKLYNSGNNLRSKNKLYKCSRENYPELTEDLIITGCHSILVGSFKTEKEKDLTIEVNGDTFVTDNKYRLPACVDDKASPYEIEGLYNIWHIALDHDDYYMNYGIFANGLLVETCSMRNLKDLSGMTLIE